MAFQGRPSGFERKDLTLSQLKEKAVRLLSRRDHSERELKLKLKTKGKFTDSDFDTLMGWLNDLGYMAKADDLSRRWVKQWRREGRGRFWIAGKLKTKGLTPPHLTDDEEELDAAKTFLDKKMGTKSLSSLDFKDKAKLARSLVSRGFSQSIVATVIGL